MSIIGGVEVDTRKALRDFTMHSVQVVVDEIECTKDTVEVKVR